MGLIAPALLPASLAIPIFLQPLNHRSPARFQAALLLCPWLCQRQERAFPVCSLVPLHPQASSSSLASSQHVYSRHFLNYPLVLLLLLEISKKTARLRVLFCFFFWEEGGREHRIKGMIKLNPVLVNQVTAPYSIGRVTGSLEVAMETALAFCFLPEAPAYFRIMCNFTFSIFPRSWFHFAWQQLPAL